MSTSPIIESDWSTRGFRSLWTPDGSATEHMCGSTSDWLPNDSRDITDDDSINLRSWLEFHNGWMCDL